MGRGVDHPRDVGLCGSGGGINGVRCQDGGVAPPEGVGFCAGEIITIYDRWWDEAWGDRWGCHGVWEQTAIIRIKSTRFPNRVNSK